ncbi:O-antigen ligase family protein [Gracilibacillus sp. S3-1-1]|uniref:O-antigen ligase family protein n=1 Tax=Gracilibacillus pellucidus TaxID=3095368 RepID=A0ACC6M3S1_9BACI|nr:O-antigen ligase family protein [Gracilibacillus sp. S3-1-1]MDX8045615.1 O-antigen ligase family protein [Gracilibacillus sp. S3-1-1]
MYGFFFLCLACLFIIAPFQQGLYFDADFYPIHLFLHIVTLIFIGLLVYKKDLASWQKVSVVLFIPICYLLSLTQAVNPNGAFDMVFRWTTYISFFFILYVSLSMHRKLKVLAPFIYYGVGVLIVGHMFLNEFGILHSNGAWEKGRFAGVFQYPNTFGMVMLAFYMFGLLLLLSKKQHWYTFFFYSFPLTAFIVALLESYARGVYLLFPLVWFIGLCCLPVRQQMRYVGYSVITSLSGFIVYVVLQTEKQWLTFISLVVLSVVSFFCSWWLKKLNGSWNSRVLLPALVVVFFSLFTLDIGNKGFVYQHMPHPLQDRIDSISSSSTANERMLMVEDALGASKDAAWIGRGGNAWEAMYHYYQQLPYQAKKIHNEYLEMIIDIGFIGFFVVIGIFIYLIFQVVWQMVRVEDRSLSLAILFSLLIILGHSMIDFNFAFGFVMWMIFWLFAMGLPVKKKAQQQVKGSYLPIIVYVALLLCTVSFSYRFLQADNAYRQMMHTDSLMEKEQLLTEATNHNPYHTEYWFELGDTYIKQQAYMSIPDVKVVHSAQMLAHLEPMNAQVLVQAAALKERIGKKEEALHQYQEALQWDRYDTAIYDDMIVLAIHLDEKQIALDTYKQLIDVYQQFEQNPIGHNHNRRRFEVTEAIKDEMKKLLIDEEREED